MQLVLSKRTVAALAWAAVMSMLAGCSDRSAVPPAPAPLGGQPVGKGTGPGGPAPRDRLAGTIMRPQFAFAIKSPEGWKESPPLATPRLLNAVSSSVPLVAVQLLSGKGDVIQVEVASVGKTDLKTHVAELIALAKKLGAKEFEQAETKVSDRPAIRRIYSTDRAGQRKTMAYYVLREGNCLALVCQTATARFDQVKPVFERAVTDLIILPDGFSMPGAPGGFGPGGGQPGKSGPGAGKGGFGPGGFAPPGGRAKGPAPKGPALPSETTAKKSS